MGKGLKGICKLCGQECDYQDSHIITKCFYPDIKDTSNKYLAVKPNGSYKIVQSGVYDSSILCKNCENKTLSKIEGNASKLFLTNEYPPIIKEGVDFKGIIYTNEFFDYKTIRQFFVSIIWRASVSTLDDFKDINLGKYENIAKEIILGKNVEYPQFFKFFIFRIPDDAKYNKVLFIKRTRFNKASSYELQMSKYRVNIIVNPDAFTNDIKDIFNSIKKNYLS